VLIISGVKIPGLSSEKDRPGFLSALYPPGGLPTVRIYQYNKHEIYLGITGTTPGGANPNRKIKAGEEKCDATTLRMPRNRMEHHL
jgi:hypothetical protein